MRLYRRRLFGALGLALLLCIWAGCSVERDYKMLSIFFDGVPDPHAPTSQPVDRPGLGPKTVVATARPMASRHVPHTDNQCKSCHTEGPLLLVSAVDGSGCISCHAKTLTDRPAMHPGVNPQSCLWCHEPHQSSEKLLLRNTTSALCLQCHDRELLSTQTVQHTDLKAPGCMSCHFAHGGERKPFLREKPLDNKPADPADKELRDILN